MPAKKVASSVFLCLTVGSALFGPVMDWPAKIAENAYRLPGIMTSPNFLWCVSWIVVTLVGLGLIWFPWRGRKEFDEALRYPDRIPAPDRYVVEYRDRLLEIVKRLAKEDRQQEAAQTIANQTKVALPLILEDQFGKRTRTRLEAIVCEVEQKAPNNPTLLFNAAIQYIDSELLSRQEKRNLKGQAKSPTML